MWRIVQIAFLLTLIIVFTHCISNDRALHNQLQRAAKEINAGAPMMFNDFVRLDGASVSSDNIFRYQYTILNTSNPDSLFEISEQLFKKSAREMYATNREMAIFRDNNVTLEYIFNDEFGRTIRVIEISPETYN